MEGEPVAPSGFIADKQGFEAVEPGIGALNSRAFAVEFGVCIRVFGRFTFTGAWIQGDVGFATAAEAIVA